MPAAVSPAPRRSTPAGSTWALEPGSNSLGVLRLAFAIGVMVSHSSGLLGRPADEPLVWLTRGQLSLGVVGVDGFFIISGFLITKSWRASSGAGDFVARRVLRIYPGFLVATAFCYLVEVPLGSASGLQALGHVRPLDSLLYALMLSAPPQVAGALADVPVRGQLDGSMWTILVEFTCYLGILAIGRATLLRRAWPMVAGLVMMVVLNGLVAVEVVPGNLAYRLFEDFAIGSAFYLCQSWIPRSRRLAAVSLIAVLVLSAAHAQLPSLVRVAVPFFEAYALFWVAAISMPAVEAFQRAGDFSYGIYLYAFPVQQLAVHVLGRGATPPEVFLLGVAGAGPLAVASWYLVERPALGLSRSRRARLGAAPPGGQPTRVVRRRALVVAGEHGVEVGLAVR